MVLRAGAPKPADLALNARSCHHSVAWGRSALSEPQFLHFSNGVDLGPCSGIGTEGVRGNPGRCLAQGWAQDSGLTVFSLDPAFLSSWAWEPLSSDDVLDRCLLNTSTERGAGYTTVSSSLLALVIATGRIKLGHEV